MNAIQLIIEDTSIILDPDTKIRIEYHNPIFDEDAIQGSKTYWFDIPAVPYNQKFFGFPELPHSSGKYKMYDNGHLLLLGYRILTGKFAVRKVQDKYRAALTTNVFGNDNDNKTLKDLTWETINMGTTVSDVLAYASARIDEDYPATKINFPAVYNPNFYGDDQNAGYRNRYDNPILNRFNYPGNTLDGFKENYLIHPDTDSSVPDGICNVTTLVPFIYLQHVLAKIFEGYNLFGEFVTEFQYQQLLLYNNHSLDNSSDEYTVKATGAYHITDATSSLNFSDYTVGSKMSASNLEGTFGIFTVKQKGYHKFKVKFLIEDNNLSEIEYYSFNIGPESGGSYASRQIIPEASPFKIEQEVTVYMVPGDVNTIVTVGLTRVIGATGEDNHEFTFLESRLDIINYSQATLNRFEKSINLENHVPKKKIPDALNHLRQFFAMPVFIDNLKRKVQLFLLKDLFDTGIIDITGKVEQKMKFELSEEVNHIYKADISDDDYFDEKDFKAYSDFNLKGNYNTFQNVPPATSMKDVVYVSSQNAVYKTRQDPLYGNVWMFYTDISQIVPANDTGKQEEKNIEACGLLMRGAAQKDSKNYQDSVYPLPKISQEGFSVIYNSGSSEQDYPLRIMKWLGKKTYEYLGGTEYYNAATTAAYDRDGNQVSNFSLTLNGESGVVAYFHSKFLDFLKKKEVVTVDANPSFNIKDLLDMIELITLPQDKALGNQKRWLMINNVRYLPRKMDVEISMRGIETVQFELIKKAND
jgi:hypothetical protein